MNQIGLTGALWIMLKQQKGAVSSCVGEYSVEMQLSLDRIRWKCRENHLQSDKILLNVIRLQHSVGFVLWLHFSLI